MTDTRLSTRVGVMAEAAGAITEILALAERPEVVSFAGGLPDPACFAAGPIADVLQRVLAEPRVPALNYGSAQGNPELRGAIAARMGERYGVTTTADAIQISSGGAEAFLLVCMALIDPGDCVLVGAPTYLVALHILRSQGARIEPVPVDDDGLSADGLEGRLRELAAQGVRPRFLYTIPSFQNPTGRTQTAARRRRIVQVAEAHDLTIVEDHAYGDLRFEGDDPPTLASLAPERVVFVHTFSKIVAPGLRLGWIAADRGLVRTLGLCKVATDSCASTLGQRIVLGLLRDDVIEPTIAAARERYRLKRDALLDALASHAPPGASWNRPEGGFYVWLDLGEGADSEALLREAITRHDVAFVAGPPFFADGEGARFLRLSYSLLPAERIDDGVRRLTATIAAASR